MKLSIKLVWPKVGPCAQEKLYFTDLEIIEMANPFPL